MDLENVLLSGRRQTQSTRTVRLHLYELSGVDTCTETESYLLVVWG